MKDSIVLNNLMLLNPQQKLTFIQQILMVMGKKKMGEKIFTYIYIYIHIYIYIFFLNKYYTIIIMFDKDFYFYFCFCFNQKNSWNGGSISINLKSTGDTVS